MQRSPRNRLNYAAPLSYAPHFGLKDAASALPFPALLLSSTTALKGSRDTTDRKQRRKEELIAKLLPTAGDKMLRHMLEREPGCREYGTT